MAYNKILPKYNNKDIKYLSKDFNTYKAQLMEFAEVYFPESFNDFSEGNPGMMFLEMAAYVGDVLSFYTDFQLQESFLALAQDRENLYNMAYAMGYKPRITTAASVVLDITQLIPTKKLGEENYAPDYDFALNIKENSTFKSTEGPIFYITKDCDFSYSSSMSPVTASVYQYDEGNNPQYFILKKQVPAISAEIREQNFTISNPQRFHSITLFDSNIIGIESVIDTEGNRWHEVPYLAQDTIFEEVANNASNDPDLYQYNNQTPYLLKLKQVPRRFISRIQPDGSIRLQFGAGTSTKSDEQIIPSPDNVGLGIKDGLSKLDKAYDPSNFLYTKTYGQAPANTTLTVNYLVGGGLGSNVNSNTITETDAVIIQSRANINPGMLNFCKSSITPTNVEPARGGGAGDTLEDLRLNTIANFSTQQRTVTKEDYMVRTLSMPSHLGHVAKAYITQDDQISPLTNEPNRIPNPLAINLYVLGYNSKLKFTTLNTATKTNLSTYLEQYRTLTDAINIKDAFVINFGIEFEITTYKNFQNSQVLLDVINELKHYFRPDTWQINQPIILSDVRNTIGAVRGVQTVENLILQNKAGAYGGYSVYKYNLDTATRNGVIYPSLDPSIFELKYPNADIKGRVTTY
jgi:hypothetical protein